MRTRRSKARVGAARASFDTVSAAVWMVSQADVEKVRLGVSMLTSEPDTVTDAVTVRMGFVLSLTSTDAPAPPSFTRSCVGAVTRTAAVGRTKQHQQPWFGAHRTHTRQRIPMSSFVKRTVNAVGGKSWLLNWSTTTCCTLNSSTASSIWLLMGVTVTYGDATRKARTASAPAPGEPSHHAQDIPSLHCPSHPLSIG